MVNELNLHQEIDILGISLPKNMLKPDDIKYLKQFDASPRLSVEQLWKEMDRVWDALDLDNRLPLNKQQIGRFYSHPVWILNGVFSASDPESVNHRDSIARFIDKIEAEFIADYGGGFGELALKVNRINSNIHIDIIEPYPSLIGEARLKEMPEIQFVPELKREYDCIIAQDVLEHVEHPIKIARKLAHSTKIGGHLIFANCFYPVIKCHLPSTFYLRHTFKWMARSLGLRFVGQIDGARHALVFRKVSRERKGIVLWAHTVICRLCGSVFNMLDDIYEKRKRGMNNVYKSSDT